MYTVLTLRIVFTALADVKNASSTEDILALLSTVEDLTCLVDHFRGHLETGDVKGLGRSLHQLLLIQPFHRNHIPLLSVSRGLQWRFCG